MTYPVSKPNCLGTCLDRILGFHYFKVRWSGMFVESVQCDGQKISNDEFSKLSKSPNILKIPLLTKTNDPMNHSVRTLIHVQKQKCICFIATATIAAIGYLYSR